MKQVIVDFDNTMGVRGCDVDDGLALLYLLGNPERVRVLGVCTTYGNNTLATVHANTLRLFSELGIELPVYEGAAGPDADAAASEAACFMAETAATHLGEVSVLATGSTTNLRGAAERDNRFFGNVADITLMGGITESLVFNGRIMDELNLSCDPAATYAVLEAAANGTDVSIATAQHCLPSWFTHDDFSRCFGEEGWITRTVAYWFADMGHAYDWTGFVCWDVVAAAMLVKPELFTACERAVTLHERLFSIGLLEQAAEGAPQAPVHTPEIADAEAFTRDVLCSWQRAFDALGL